MTDDVTSEEDALSRDELAHRTLADVSGRRTSPMEAAGNFLKALGSSATWLRQIVVDLGVTIPVILVVILVAQDVSLSNTTITIEPISIPQSLSNKGVNSTVIAARLRDSITNVEDVALTDDIQRALDASKKLRGYSSREDLPDFTVPESSVSVSSVAGYLKTLLGVSGKSITGEITEMPNGELVLRLRLEGVLLDSGSAATADNLDGLLLEGAKKIVGKFKPAELAAYLYETGDVKQPESYDPALSKAQLVASTKPVPDGKPDVEIALANTIWAEVLFQRTFKDLAIKRQRIATTFDKTDAWVWERLGRFDEDAGNNDAAVRDYTTEVQQDNHDGWAFSYLAGALEKKQRYVEEIRVATQGLDDPEHCVPRLCSALYGEIASASVKLHRHKQALAYYSLAATSDPGNISATRGWAEELNNDDQYDASAATYAILGQQLTLVSRFDDAAEAFVTASRYTPQYPYYAAMAGKSYWRAGLYDRAISIYQNLLGQYPHYANYHFNVVVSLEGKAIDTFSKREKLVILKAACENLRAMASDLADYPEGQDPPPQDPDAIAARLNTESGNTLGCKADDDP
ncbi:MAG TPA: hypothetical protein VHZ78_08370 [Rhizomicrobium sp.]|jgi:tetratricopeptide (TPR) repeat protein|nr:hypothetical protein [Rhizomicrobium sp.]